MNFEEIKKEWAARRRDIQTWLSALERFQKQLGKRTDPRASWARPQLEQETDRVRADLASGDARFAAIETAYVSYAATAAEVQRTAVSLDASDALQLVHIGAQRAAFAAWAVFVETATGWAIPSIGSSTLRRGFLKSIGSTSTKLSDAAAIAEKAGDLANYVPGERNSSAASTAYDVAYGAGLVEPPQMVIEVVAESEYPDARLGFDVRWMRFAHNHGLPSEIVKYPALTSEAELAYKPATIGRLAAERARDRVDW